MSWKAVEMQVALPRVQDAAKLQEQIAERNPTLQHFINQRRLKTEQKKRQTVHKQEDVEGTEINQEDVSSDKSLPQKKDELELSLDHPYLGKKIDYSG